MQYVEGTVFDGRFLLKKFKGSGSFGEVWLAVDQQTGIEVISLDDVIWKNSVNRM